MLDQVATRAWCEGLARTLAVQHVTPRGQPYLDRYFVAGWSPTDRQHFGAIYLHHFLASDPDDQVHSHPWGWARSVILVGGYREYRCDRAGGAIVRDYLPGEINVLEPEDQHRIELLEGDCWSVFLAGSYAEPWNFAPGCS